MSLEEGDGVVSPLINAQITVTGKSLVHHQEVFTVNPRPPITVSSVQEVLKAERW